jgi:hypothetical protein
MLYGTVVDRVLAYFRVTLKKYKIKKFIQYARTIQNKFISLNFCIEPILICIYIMCFEFSTGAFVHH